MYRSADAISEPSWNSKTGQLYHQLSGIPVSLSLPLLIPPPLIQVFHYTDLKFSPQRSKSGGYYVSSTSLPPMISSVESKLGLFAQRIII